MKVLNKTSAIAIYDKEGNLTEITDFYLKKKNKKREDLIGKNHKDFIDIETGEQREAYRKFRDNLQKGKAVNEINFISDKNKIKCISDTYMPVFNTKGEMTKFVKISNDITQNIPTEELEKNMIALRQQLAKKGRKRNK